MNIYKEKLEGVLIIEPKVFLDERGFFFESFNQKEFDNAVGKSTVFVQDNHSKSVKGVLRGLHFQKMPFAQAKLVRCIHGEVFDVIVDIRKGSRTFGEYISLLLSADNKKQLWIPEGFAHGFLTLSESAEILYKTSNYHDVESKHTIRWDDRTIGIKWPEIDNLFLSLKDQLGLAFTDISF